MKPKESLQPITLEEKVDLPVPASLNEVIENVPVNNEPITNNTIEEPINVSNKNNENSGEEPIKNSDRKVKLFLGILIFLVILGVIFVGVLYVFNANYKKLLVKSFESFKQYNIFEKHNLSFEDYSLKGDLKFDMETGDNEIDNILESIFDNKINYDIIKNEKDYDMNFNIVNKSTEVIDTNFIIKDSKLFAFIKDVYDKYIFIDKLEDFNKVSNEEIRHTLSTGYNLFIDNINKESYSSENTKIKIDNKDQNVRSTKIKLTEKEINRIINIVVNTLENDEKSKEIIKIVKENMSDYLEMKEFGNSYIEYTIYSKGIMHNVVGIDFVSVSETVDYEKWYASDCSYSDEECNDEKPMKKVTNKLEYRVGEKSAILNVYYDKELEQTFIIKRKDNILQIDFNDEVDTVGTIIITRKDTNTNIAVETSYNGTVSTINIDYELKEINKKEYDINIDYNQKIKQDEQSLSFSVKSNNKLKNEKVEIKEPKNKINFDDIPASDMENIEEQLILKLYKLIGMEDEYFVSDNDYYEESY